MFIAQGCNLFLYARLTPYTIMVELEMDGFVLQVPLKSKMTISELMAIIEKVEHVAKANERGIRVMEQHELEHAAPQLMPQVAAQPVAQPAPVVEQPIAPMQFTPEDFKLPGEELIKVQHLSNQVRSHVDHIKRHEDVLTRHEKHLNEILQYLQSLDRYIRR